MIKIIHAATNSTLKRILLATLAVSLALTGGLFAYAYTSATTSITATTGSADFASVTTNSTVPSYTIFGSYRGRIQSGNLFEVTPSSGYPGDLQVNVYLSNIDELSYNYGLFMLRLQLVDGSNNKQDMEAITKVLTLNNGVVSFISDNLTPGTTYYVKTIGGIYRSYPWVYLGNQSIYSPELYAEVVQAGL
ncbi:MAG: hypothetical protein V3V23_04410 [Dehalococcoidales bacterium]